MLYIQVQDKRVLLKTLWLRIVKGIVLLASLVIPNWRLSDNNNLLSHRDLVKPQVPT